ncbi:winged helix-turn-helix domain-containing protein [Vibrio sp. HN007]|uniref:winged helix-turn-helix domain-containing protein n=1 Tax=Vibrio iocasae TaxID=3098914 RepID=UPI0035D46369
MDSIIDITRKVELDFLEQQLIAQEADIVALYGIAGIGKSSLINRFVKLHQQKCIKIDCQLVEPTPKAFCEELQVLLKSDDSNLGSIRSGFESGSILVLDQFESINLIESWLRRVFIPEMRGCVRYLFSGRLHPDHQWVINPPLEMNYRCFKLNSLSFQASVDYLKLQKHTQAVAMGINQFANGHPLALKLASHAIHEQPERSLAETPPNDVILTLVNYFLEDVQSPDLRRALEATSIVRRISESLLSSMLNIGQSEASNLYEQLAEIDFIELRQDGLSLHDVLKNVLSSNLKARAPDRYCEYRHRASEVLLNEMKSVTSSQLWRYTSDILYLVDNNVIRNAFFPPDDFREYSVEPANEENQEAILDIVQQHEPASCVDIYHRWWERHSNVFHVVKDNSDLVQGFYCLINPDAVSSRLLAQDPMTDLWNKHSLDCQSKPNSRIFIRRWMSFNEGESLSGIQASCWLDIKRIYLEMRPELRYVYLTLTDLQPYAAVASELGFQVIEQDIDIDGRKYYSAVLDMGEGSVDGWISKRLLNEVSRDTENVSSPDWFDKEARQLCISEQRVDLTPLEFGTLDWLIQRKGGAVTRKELLRQVWGIQYEGSSNVVDTIILSLRKKLKEKSKLVQSVRGTGYRYSED